MTVVSRIVTYPVKFVPPGGRTPQDGLVHQAFPFEIREAERKEGAPGVTIRGGGKEAVWRLFGGDLHRVLPDRAQSKSVALEDLKFREILSHGRDRALAEMQDRMSTGALFEGQAFVPCPGPFIRLRAIGYGSDRWSQAHCHVMGPSTPDAFSFGVEEDLEEIALKTNSLAQYRENEEKVLKMVAELRDRMTIHVPGCTEPDRIAAAAVVETASRVFDTELTNRKIGGYPAAHLRGWSRYHSGAVETGTPNEDLIDLLRAAGAAKGEVRGTDDADVRLRNLLSEAKMMAWRMDRSPAPSPTP